MQTMWLLSAAAAVPAGHASAWQPLMAVAASSQHLHPDPPFPVYPLPALSRSCGSAHCPILRPRRWPA